MFQRLIREPLLHFIGLGTVLFILYSWSQGGSLVDHDNTILITDADRQFLASSWRQQWKREPSIDEWQALMDDYVRQEILYREALALGLDKNDTLVKRRLVQKMEFLINDQILPPSEAELRDWFKRNKFRYQKPTTLSFSQIYFSTAQGDASAHKRGQQLIEYVLDNDLTPTDDVLFSGDPIPLPRQMRQVDHATVERDFGQQFADALFNTQGNGWQEVLPSSFGFHVVYIDTIEKPSNPSYSEIQNQVLYDWSAESRESYNRKAYQKVRQRYQVKLNPSDSNNVSVGG